MSTSPFFVISSGFLLEIYPGLYQNLVHLNSNNSNIALDLELTRALKKAK